MSGETPAEATSWHLSSRPGAFRATLFSVGNEGRMLRVMISPEIIEQHVPAFAGHSEMRQWVEDACELLHGIEGIDLLDDDRNRRVLELLRRMENP